MIQNSACRTGLVPGPQYLCRHCLAVWADTARSEGQNCGLKAWCIPVHQCAAPQLTLSLVVFPYLPGTRLASGPRMEEADHADITLCAVKTCSFHTCLCMQAPWILGYLGCKSGSDGMHFPLEAELVCLMFVSLYSLSLHVSFVFLVFICAPNDYDLTVYEIKGRRKLVVKSQGREPNTCFFSWSFALILLCVTCPPHKEKDMNNLTWVHGSGNWILVHLFPAVWLTVYLWNPES